MKITFNRYSFEKGFPFLENVEIKAHGDINRDYFRDDMVFDRRAPLFFTKTEIVAIEYYFSTGEFRLHLGTSESGHWYSFAHIWTKGQCLADIMKDQDKWIKIIRAQDEIKRFAYLYGIRQEDTYENENEEEYSYEDYEDEDLPF